MHHGFHNAGFVHKPMQNAKTDSMNIRQATFPRPWLALTAVCACAGLLLGAANALTAPAIERGQQSGAALDRAAVFPGAEGFNDLSLPEDAAVSACAEALIDGAAAGYVASITVNGYKGPVEITLGLDSGGTVTGLRVGGAAFMESLCVG